MAAKVPGTVATTAAEETSRTVPLLSEFAAKRRSLLAREAPFAFLYQSMRRTPAGFLFSVILAGTAMFSSAFDPAAAAASPFDPVTGYRMSHYKAPVEPAPEGVTRLGLDELQRLIAAKKPVLVDVLPADGGRPDRATGIWQLRQPHSDIPGSHWLPEVGRGKLEPWQERYFAGRLAALTGGDKAKPIVVYCQSDCWMAWNALKRARALGYTALYWYPDGTDGWRDFDAELAPVTPDPVDPALFQDGR
jgi:PQQ-dependent catabolism-associated CXXCW motif protein